MFSCKTNYRSLQDKTMYGEINKIPVYHFQKKQWKKRGRDFDTIEVHGKICPKNPPSVRPGVPGSQRPTPSVVLRNIKKTSDTVRNQIADELNVFLELDKINYTNLKESLINNKKVQL